MRTFDSTKAETMKPTTSQIELVKTVAEDFEIEISNDQAIICASQILENQACSLGSFYTHTKNYFAQA
tara:strand:+ start:2802 stop:3005 length:204 start_codon:yes stop_codon:yes gene_type:complete